jgi:hypothetical protein
VVGRRVERVPGRPHRVDAGVTDHDEHVCVHPESAV